MDSWECLTDVEIDELVSVASSNGPQTSNPWWLPSPDEIAHAPAVDSASHIAYTHHQGRCESPVVHDDLSELLCAPDGTQPMALLLSSFLPFEPKFLQHFPPNADITVCIHDEKKKKTRRFLYGMELEDMLCMKEQQAYRATSTFCTRCMPSCQDRDCETRDFLKKCKCRESFQRRVHWVLCQPKGTNIMHSKIMLLRFRGFLRFVVSSFNLSQEQWTKAGDSFWWADIPFCEPADVAENKVQLPLLDMLQRLAVPFEWQQLLARCDFRCLQTAGHSQVHLITSVPDESSPVCEYGMERLRLVLSTLPRFPPSHQTPVHVQVWSLGASKDSWYVDFSSVLTGEMSSQLGFLSEWKHDHVQFIFQTNGCGWNWFKIGARRMQTENRFLRILDEPELSPQLSAVQQVLWDEADSVLLGKRAAPEVTWGWHSKVMSRVYPQGFCKRSGCTRTHGWRYFGSHNCSRASWGWRWRNAERGIFVMDPARNFEAGVVLTSVPASLGDDECGVDLDELAPLPFKPSQLVRHG